jgi:hypothetical protein
MTMGNETTGAVSEIGGVVDAGTLSASESVPGNFRQLFEDRRDIGVDIDGDGDAEEVGEFLVAFHVAVEAKRDNGAEYELNNPSKPPGAALPS